MYNKFSLYYIFTFGMFFYQIFLLFIFVVFVTILQRRKVLKEILNFNTKFFLNFSIIKIIDINQSII